MDVLILVGAFVVILAGAELFTNGIEWFGRKLELAEGAVGSVLAAVGTALPETMIPIIAILTGGGSDRTSPPAGRRPSSGWASSACSRRPRCGCSAPSSGSRGQGSGGWSASLLRSWSWSRSALWPDF